MLKAIREGDSDSRLASLSKLDLFPLIKMLVFLIDSPNWFAMEFITLQVLFLDSNFEFDF